MSFELAYLLDLYEKYPIGSRVVVWVEGYGSGYKKSACKVIGYHEKYGSVLIYNPEIRGHDGSGHTVNEIGENIPLEDIKKNYQNHCWYVGVENLEEGGG